MPSATDEIDNISARDIAILKARIEHPTASVRVLRERLEDEYGISLSHNRVNDILRNLSDKDVFRQVSLLNESFFEYHLFQIAFHYPNFEDRWEECYDDLMNDPHVLMFFNADDYHHWQFIARFRKDEKSESWKHKFFKKHGDLIAQFDSSALPEIHKFRNDTEVLEQILHETDEGKKFVKNNDGETEDREEDIDDETERVVATDGGEHD
ncbi:helix-turn-helix domain-containing protein [Natrialba sp. PRR66]|uniref:helix-turn-helix domain-containing protein n=1 Tax=Natrialba sp. PRR66 TaxID=3098146 RepID=UPI002B1DB5FD|nr:helix-turn-helix domain-containing protein [Natrialba sp. PRR66]